MWRALLFLIGLRLLLKRDLDRNFSKILLDTGGYERILTISVAMPIFPSRTDMRNSEIVKSKIRNPSI